MCPPKFLITLRPCRRLVAEHNILYCRLSDVSASDARLPFFKRAQKESSDIIAVGAVCVTLAYQDDPLVTLATGADRKSVV